MKKIYYYCIATIMLIPILLIFNDNYETVHINFIGIGYLGLLYYIMTYTKKGKKLFLKIFKNIN